MHVRCLLLIGAPPMPPTPRKIYEQMLMLFLECWCMQALNANAITYMQASNANTKQATHAIFCECTARKYSLIIYGVLLDAWAKPDSNIPYIPYI